MDEVMAKVGNDGACWHLGKIYLNQALDCYGWDMKLLQSLVFFASTNELITETWKHHKNTSNNVQQSLVLAFHGSTTDY